MDAEAMARAFKPPFSTKATGTGLGLTIAKRNVELNGGTIAADQRERSVGTTVENYDCQPPPMRSKTERHVGRQDAGSFLCIRRQGRLRIVRVYAAAGGYQARPTNADAR